MIPPSPNQPKPTYRAPTSEADQLLNNISPKQNFPKANGSASAESSIDYDSSAPEGSPQPLNYEGELSPTAVGDSYFPQDINTKNQQKSNDFGSFLQPPSKPSSSNAPQDGGSFQTFFNYQPENSEIPNVPPPPLPVKQNENNSTKKKVDYPNAPPTFFTL